MPLPEGEALFRAVFEQAAVGVALLETATGRYLRVNQAHADLVGYTREELERIDFQTITHPDDLQPDIALMERVVAGEATSFTMEKRYVRKDGSIVWVSLTVTPLWKHGETPTFHVAMVQDITERKRVEEALRESEAKYRTLYTDAPVMLHSIDSEGRILSVSNRWLEVLGYTLDEVIGHKSVEFLTPASARYAEEVVLPRFFVEGTCTDVAYQFVKKSGAVLDVKLSAIAERDAQGRYVCSRAALVDVTQHNRVEEALRHAQKLESVGRLAGGVAHDFNNLLAAILGNAELAAMRVPADTPLHRDLAEVRKAAERAASLTRQLLAFSRKQVLQPQTLSLNRVVADIETMLRRLLRPPIALELTLAPGLPATSADPGQLEQVIMNLVMNAQDAMPDGGTVTIATEAVVVGDTTVASLRSGRYVVLSVTDTGVGLDDDTRARVFEPFFTTKALGKGTGLGLATAYGIVKQSGGEITVTSTPGHGASFRVYLPAAATPAAHVEPAPASHGEGAGHETVLVVEDDPAVRSVAIRALERAGYTVLAAEDGEEALRVCKTHDGPIDLALTDVVMPRLDGPGFVARVAPWRPDLRVLFMSGHAEDSMGLNGRVNPDTVFLQKPFTPTELAQRVRAALDAPRQ